MNGYVAAQVERGVPEDLVDEVALLGGHRGSCRGFFAEARSGLSQMYISAKLVIVKLVASKVDCRGDQETHGGRG